MTTNVTVNQAEAMSTKELMDLCKELNLPRYHGKTRMNKSELLENLKPYLIVDDVQQNVEAVEENVVTENVEEKPKRRFEDIDVEGFFKTKNKERYIESAEAGTIVAFVDDNGKPRTAAIVNRSSKRRVLKVVTEFNWEFIVPYDKVIWVKNGNKWPNAVYTYLKGYSTHGKKVVK